MTGPPTSTSHSDVQSPHSDLVFASHHFVLVLVGVVDLVDAGRVGDVGLGRILVGLIKTLLERLWGVGQERDGCEVVSVP